MNRGRKRVPVATKKLRGTFRRDREPVDNLPRNGQATTDIPDELDGDAAARAEWRRRAAAGWTARVDRALLIAWCLELSRYQRACRLSRRGDMTIRRGSGGRGIHPAIAIAHRTGQTLIRLAELCGFTPHSRAGAPPAGPEPDDAFAEFDRPLRTN